MKFVNAGALTVAFSDSGLPSGPPVILLHGFPYDVHAYDEVTPALTAEGCRVIVPFLRGYGATRFNAADTLRSGQQAALGADLLDLMNALGIPKATLAGYDWGGRAACIVAALWPERVQGLLSGTGYNIQNIAAAAEPAAPEAEYLLWYQYYFHGERGRAGLQRNRAEYCRLLWRLWSPSWRFDDAVYARTAASFDNPDFVDVVIHSYRHRFGLVPGDPAVEPLEQRLAAQPPIRVPTIVLHGADDGVSPLKESDTAARHFTGGYERHILPGVGHNIPQEAPAAFASAVRRLVNGEVA